MLRRPLRETTFELRTVLVIESGPSARRRRAPARQLHKWAPGERLGRDDPSENLCGPTCVAGSPPFFLPVTASSLGDSCIEGTQTGDAVRDSPN